MNKMNYYMTNLMYIKEFRFIYVKYEWYIMGVEYNWDYNMDPTPPLVIHSLPPSSFLTVLSCIPLTVVGLLVLYSFFPTGNVEQSMLERNRRGSDITSGVNLLCCNAFFNRRGSSLHYGTFVYNNNDPSGRSIQGLFYLGPPITANVYGRVYTGYLKIEDDMWTRIHGQRNMSAVLSRSMDGVYDTPGAGYVISRAQLENIRANKHVYSGNEHLVPDIPVMWSPYYGSAERLPVHIRSFAGHAFINRLP